MVEKPEEYLEWRDEWMQERGLFYEEMKKDYNKRTKTTLDDLAKMYFDLKEMS
jgi:hypothetical protein